MLRTKDGRITLKLYVSAEETNENEQNEQSE